MLTDKLPTTAFELAAMAIIKTTALLPLPDIDRWLPNGSFDDRADAHYHI